MRCRKALLRTSKRDGFLWSQKYAKGKPKSPVKKGKAARGSGTKITFLPDEEIFGEKLRFDAALINDRLEAKSFLHKGVKISFRDESVKPAKSTSFQHENGVADYLKKSNCRPQAHSRPERVGRLLPAQNRRRHLRVIAFLDRSNRRTYSISCKRRADPSRRNARARIEECCC